MEGSKVCWKVAGLQQKGTFPASVSGDWSVIFEFSSPNMVSVWT